MSDVVRPLDASRTDLAVRAGAVLAALLASACASPRTEAQRATASTIVRTTFMHVGFGAGPVVFTDVRGRLVEERRYEPFGEPIDARVHDDGGDVVGSPDLVDRDLAPSGARTDAATGWSDHGARWMVPETGRWLSPDPPVVGPDAAFAAAPWRLHPYQYVDQNPVAYWDPDGREPDSVGRQLVAHERARTEIASWRTFHQQQAEASINVRVPDGPARAAALALARSSNPIDINTARHLATDFDVLYLEDLVHPANEAERLAELGLSPDIWQVLLLPNRAHAIYVLRASDGTSYKGTLIGRRAKSVEFWKGIETHELNHELNGDTVDGRDLARQYDGELRAYWVSTFRDVSVGERASRIKAHILANYPQFNAAYRSDEAFRAHVDHARVTGNVTNR